MNPEDKFRKSILMQMGSRYLSVFPELKELTDTDHWLLCSEGRSRLMQWLRFDPKMICNDR
jgi:hypothetical protein